MNTVDALLFDVFGTLVDWRTSVTGQLQQYMQGAAENIRYPAGTDWEAVVLDWRDCYQPSMEAVRSGKREFVILDVLHRESLITTFARHQITGFSESQLDVLAKLWHTLEPWPDVPAGLLQLRSHYTLAAVSNGNTELLKNLSRHASMKWHVCLGAEPARCYKPQPGAYLYSAALLGLDPHECMMVAAHNSDLQAARALGFRTAYINRPTEYGARQHEDIGPESDWDFCVESLEELAASLVAELPLRQQ